MENRRIGFFLPCRFRNRDRKREEQDWPQIGRIFADYRKDNLMIFLLILICVNLR